MKIKDFLLILSAFLITLILLELFLRVTEITLPSFVYDDQVLGRTHKAGSLVHLKNAEGFYLGRINEGGYPGKFYPPARTPNNIRIALIGDSYVEGFQLFERDHFSRLLEARLNKMSSKKVEVLNFGTGGADSRGMFLRFEKLAVNYNPDIVLFFVKEEDLIKRDAIPMPTTHFSNDSIFYTNNFNDNSESLVRKQFAFVRDYSIGNLIKEVYEVYHNGKLLNVITDGLISEENLTNKETGINSNKDEFFEINMAILKSLSSERFRRFNPTIVKINSYPDSYDSILSKLKIPIVDLQTELEKYDNKKMTYWAASGKYGHWNHYANSIIAEFLSKDLLKIINI